VKLVDPYEYAIRGRVTRARGVARTIAGRMRWMAVPIASFVSLLFVVALTQGRAEMAESPSPLRVHIAANTAHSARLTWDRVDADSIEVFRDGRLLDSLRPGAQNFRDLLLWPRTRYTYRVTAVRDGAVIAQWRGAVTTERLRRFPRPYSRASFWNERIGPDPRIDPDSAGMVAAAFASHATSANLTNSDEWGYPIAYANRGTRSYDIACTRYGCDQDVDFRIPSHAVANTGADGHLSVVDLATNRELDMYRAAYTDGRWSAGSRYITRVDGRGAMCPAGQRCDGAIASGLASLGGIVRPEEIAEGRIRHALAIAVPHTRGDYIACPATHASGDNVGDETALPMGARIQLDPSFDVSAQPWPRWTKTIAVALQRYGAYVVDTSSSLEVRAEAARLTRGYDAWRLVGLSSDSPSLSTIPWDRLQVLNIRRC
jgi:hypothetical protein